MEFSECNNEVATCIVYYGLEKSRFSILKFSQSYKRHFLGCPELQSWIYHDSSLSCLFHLTRAGLIDLYVPLLVFYT